MKDKYGCVAVKCVYRIMAGDNIAVCALVKCPYNCRVKMKGVSESDVAGIKQSKKISVGNKAVTGKNITAANAD